MGLGQVTEWDDSYVPHSPRHCARNLSDVLCTKYLTKSIYLWVFSRGRNEGSHRCYGMNDVGVVPSYTSRSFLYLISHLLSES